MTRWWVVEEQDLLDDLLVIIILGALDNTFFAGETFRGEDRSRGDDAREIPKLGDRAGRYDTAADYGPSMVKFMES